MVDMMSLVDVSELLTLVKLLALLAARFVVFLFRLAEAEADAEADAKGVVVVEAQSVVFDSYMSADVLQRFALDAAPLSALFIPFLDVGVFLYVFTLLGRGVLNALAIIDFVLESIC